jgi:cysteine/O-acetylserine efflux protein
LTGIPKKQFNRLMPVDIPATLIFVFVTTFTPGPNNVLSGSMGAIHGYRRAMPLMLGIASGFFVIMLLCATLSSLLATYLPRVAPSLRIIGGMYILWLAYGVYRSSAGLFDVDEDIAPLRFWNGWALQFVNAKTILYGLTLYSVFLSPLLDNRLTLVWSAAGLALASFTSITTWALAGHFVRGWVKTPKRARLLGVVLAAALVYTALEMAGAFHR